MSLDSTRDTTTKKVQEVTVVEVRNPLTYENTKLGGKSYTAFEVCIKTTNKAFIISPSFVRRRYSDFVWLRAWLQKNNGGFSNRKTPSLPPKKLVRRFDTEFLQQRMKGLQKFLRKVIEQNVYLSDKALHLFLQSEMSVKEIENYLSGRIPVEDSLNISLEEEEEYKLAHAESPLKKILEIPNVNNGSSYNDCESLATTSSYSSISSSFADSFEKISAHDCIPEVVTGASSFKTSFDNECDKKIMTRDGFTTDMVEPENVLESSSSSSSYDKAETDVKNDCTNSVVPTTEIIQKDVESRNSTQENG